MPDLSDRDLYLILNLSSGPLWLVGVDLAGVMLKHADFAGADLRGANLTGANLAGANLKSAHLEGARLVQANLQGADLSGATLIGADVRGANLHEIVLDQAAMGGMHYNSDTRWPKDVDPQDLGAVLADSTGWLGTA